VQEGLRLAVLELQEQPVVCVRRDAEFSARKVIEKKATTSVPVGPSGCAGFMA